MESIIIDNCIISKIMVNEISITPISLAKKKNPLLNINLQKITYGSRENDNSVISQLSTGVLKYEDIFYENIILK
jgi:predicted aspartyl protease